MYEELKRHIETGTNGVWIGVWNAVLDTILGDKVIAAIAKSASV